MLARRRLAMRIRRALHGWRDVHPSCYFVAGSRVSRDLVAGEYCFMNYGCDIGPNVELGRYVLIGPRVAIVGGDHAFSLADKPMIFSGRPELPRTVVEDDVWLGFGAIVVAGVRIGRGSIVAAGSVVTKDVPPYEVHGGVPGRKLRDRFTDPEQIRVHEAMLVLPAFEGEYATRKGAQ